MGLAGPQVARKLGTHSWAEFGARLVSWVVDHKANGRRRVHEPAGQRRWDLEAKVLDGCHLLLFRMAALESSRQLVLPDDELDAAAVDALKAVDGSPDLGLAHEMKISDLDEQSGRKLPVAGHQRVVRVELFLNLAVLDDPLSPDHLLHLEQDGLPVLEEESDVVSDGQPTVPLESDDTRPHLLPSALVFQEVLHISHLDGLHGAS